MIRTIEVVAAVIVQDGKVFVTQRGYGDFKGWWEFPGGKIEPGETPQQALKREIQEELGVTISVGQLLCTVNYDYPAFHLVMHCYLSEILSGVIELKEHESARWLTATTLNGVKWLPADKDVVEKLETILTL